MLEKVMLISKKLCDALGAKAKREMVCKRQKVHTDLGWTMNGGTLCQ